MDTASVASLKALLVGVDLPAGKDALLAYAVHQRAEPTLLAVLRTLPDRRYESLDEVAEALLHVQPSVAAAHPKPREETGLPPGGDAYTDPNPDTGQVRDLDKVKPS